MVSPGRSGKKSERPSLEDAGSVYLPVGATPSERRARLLARGSPVDEEPSDFSVAVCIGISEQQVPLYRRETFHLGDGSWLVHFAFSMPKELRQQLTGSFTLLLKAPRAFGDARWTDEA